jgi:hypothetical protein
MTEKELSYIIPDGSNTLMFKISYGNREKVNRTGQESEMAGKEKPNAHNKSSYRRLIGDDKVKYRIKPPEINNGECERILRGHTTGCCHSRSLTNRMRYRLITPMRWKSLLHCAVVEKRLISFKETHLLYIPSLDTMGLRRI